MNIHEFVEATGKLEKYYDKEYSKEQIKIMFEALKEMPLATYNRAINLCLNTCKFLPKIADIKKALTDYTVIDKSPVQTIEFVECNKCSDGFITYYKEKDGIAYQYEALCTCENGKNQRMINKHMFPFINEIGLGD